VTTWRRTRSTTSTTRADGRACLRCCSAGEFGQRPIVVVVRADGVAFSRGCRRAFSVRRTNTRR